MNMAHVHFEVKYYRVSLTRGVAEGANIFGWVQCLDKQADWVYGFTVFFVPDDDNLPPSFYNPAVKSGATFRPISQMPLYIDLLRNEAPVFVSMNDEIEDLNRVSTWPEPVGEGE
jgi:hypothetical protein